MKELEQAAKEWAYRYQEGDNFDSAFIAGANWQSEQENEIIRQMMEDNEKLSKKLNLASTWAKGVICKFLLRLPAELMVKYNIDADEISIDLDKALSVDSLTKETL